jgi:hypothetical protein
MLFGLFDVQLPDWSTIRREKKKFRKMLAMDIRPSISILGTPTFTVSIPGIIAQEIANPLVSPLIKYYPEESFGKDVYQFSQSKKWLEELEPHSRAPMCRINGRDWYLFEPVQLATNEIVVPLFFYCVGSEMFSKCISLQFHIGNTQSTLRLTFPAGLSFRSNMLLHTRVSEFYNEYSNIIDGEGNKLSERCGNILYGEYIMIRSSSF